MSEITPNFWIFRVGDGVNFKNSKQPFWGVKRGKNGCIKTVVKKLNVGDVCIFLTSKSYGGNVIGIAEYTGFYDREDEPLIPIHTSTNEEQNWIGDDPWDIQIHYTNLYLTEKQKITACIQCGGIIMEYSKFQDNFNGDMRIHYANFKLYAEPKLF